ncbi:hypothetical protein Zmor_024477 [Zophobas morio]|uniref:Uncharacterized protein n=1 Tax=Zophobas morio TaxID=2755281 RepID=A0AA38HYK4_9CUCU|nr:hypothetical protein Zmor_024477 [Zophobas morio]
MAAAKVSLYYNQLRHDSAESQSEVKYRLNYFLADSSFQPSPNPNNNLLSAHVACRKKVSNPKSAPRELSFTSSPSLHPQITLSLSLPEILNHQISLNTSLMRRDAY